MKTILFNWLFKIFNFLLRLKNANKLRIFIYTDSRGHNVISPFGKTPFGSYVLKLAWKYRVTYFVCPEKYTTLLDFLNQCSKMDLTKYEIVILHCGVVDFSPRPKTNIQRLRETKRGTFFQELFEDNKDHHENVFGEKYRGEYTSTLYSIDYFENKICNNISKIENLIWINSNHFVKGWEGNYINGRPSNIDNVISTYDEVLSKYIKNIVSLKEWNNEQIKLYTIDNIHFTLKGFNEIFCKIESKINKIF